MNKENVLFSIVGLLLGYVFAFTIATHYNLSGAAADGGSLTRAGSPADGRADTNPEVQRMREQIAQVEGQARQQPNDFDLQMEAAKINFEFGRFEEAMDFLVQALKLRPGDHTVHLGLALVNESTARYEMAEHWYKEAIKARPNDPFLRNYLGMNYLRRRPSDVEKALDEFRRAFELDPTEELTLQNLTTALARKAKDEAADKNVRRKSLEEAEETLAKLETLNPDNEAVPNLRATISTARNSLESSSGKGRG